MYGRQLKPQVKLSVFTDYAPSKHLQLQKQNAAYNEPLTNHSQLLCLFFLSLLSVHASPVCYSYKYTQESGIYISLESGIHINLQKYFKGGIY